MRLPQLLRDALTRPGPFSPTMTRDDFLAAVRDEADRARAFERENTCPPVRVAPGTYLPLWLDVDVDRRSQQQHRSRLARLEAARRSSVQLHALAAEHGVRIVEPAH